jgi:acyl-CoA reductase-like NAD-dependent aldehyde dehydrogenase
MRMNAKTSLIGEHRMTARELRKLPPHERDAILKAAAERAAQDYRTDVELNQFEAFGKADLYGESADTETR